MKSLKTKVLLSGLVVLFALIATVGSTFAWFTVSSQVNVEALNLSVTSMDSILIRVYRQDNGTQFYHAGTVGESNILNLDGTVAYTNTATNTYSKVGSALVFTLTGGALQNPTPADVIPAANLHETVLLAKTAEGLFDATTYVTTLTSAMVTAAAYTGLSSWKIQPVTVIQDGYVTISGKNLNSVNSISTNFARTLTSATSANSATGQFVELKFWVMSQGTTAVDLTLGALAITPISSGVLAQAVDAARIAVWADSDAEFVYGTDFDYGFTFVNNLPGYYTGSPVVAGAFNSIAAGSVTTLLGFSGKLDNLAQANPSIITNLVQNTPKLMTLRFFIEGWDADATNNIIAAAFSIAFTLKIKNSGE